MEKHTKILSILLITILSITCYNLLGQDSTTKTLEMDFKKWQQQFSIADYRMVSEIERLYRIKVYEKNVQQINLHNSKLGKSYKLGTNQFLALTKQQFKSQYLGTYSKNQNYQQSAEELQGMAIDWVFNKTVTSVKNQGKCSANYAFATIGAMQGMSKIYGQGLVQYSAQQLVDCSWPYGNKGCDGGQPQLSYNYLRIFNLQLQSIYPWTGEKYHCQAASMNRLIQGHETVNDCTNLAIALRSRPLSVVIDGANLQFYKSGVFNNCGTDLSLPLLLVGLLDPFFTLKNSWGTTWGEDGYLRISRGNTCGVCMSVTYPVPK